MCISSICSDQGLCSTKTASIVLGSVAGLAALVTGVALLAIFVPPVAATLALGALALYFGVGVSALLALACGIGAVYLFLKGDAAPLPVQPEQPQSLLPLATNLNSPLGEFNSFPNQCIAEGEVHLRKYYFLNPANYQDLPLRDYKSDSRNYRIQTLYMIGLEPLKGANGSHVNKNDLNGMLKLANEIAGKKDERILIASERYGDYVALMAFVVMIERYRVFGERLKEDDVKNNLEDTVLPMCEKELGYNLPETAKINLFSKETLARLKTTILTKS